MTIMTSKVADMEANKAVNMVAVEIKEAMVEVDNRTSMDLDVSSREAMEVVEMNMDLVVRSLSHIWITS